MSSDNSVSSNTSHEDLALFRQAEQLKLEHAEQIAEVPAHEQDNEDIADAQLVQEAPIEAELAQENEPHQLDEQPNVEEQKNELNIQEEEEKKEEVPIEEAEESVSSSSLSEELDLTDEQIDERMEQAWDPQVLTQKARQRVLHSTLLVAASTASKNVMGRTKLRKNMVKFN